MFSLTRFVLSSSSHNFENPTNHIMCDIALPMSCSKFRAVFGKRVSYDLNIELIANQFGAKHFEKLFASLSLIIICFANVGCGSRSYTDNT